MTGAFFYFEPELAPTFIDSNRHGIGQVQAAAALAHRQTQAMTVGQRVKHFRRQAPAFRAEQEGVTFGKADIMERLRTLGGEREQPWVAQAFQATRQVCVALERGVLVVVQPGAAQALVVHVEAQRLDQMQVAATVGAQPDNVAGIRRNFWLKKDDVKHARLRR